MALDMTVNRLPARTWNWLKMNESSLKDMEARGSCFVKMEGSAAVDENGNAPEGPSAGVSGELSEELCAGAKAEDGAGENGAEDEETDFSSIATGMGEDMDRLAAEADASTIRIFGGESSLHFQCKDGEKSFQRVEISAAAGETVTVIMDYTSDAHAAGLAAFQTRIMMDQGAKVRLVQVQLLGEGYTVLNDVGALCGDDAQLQVVQLFLGGEKTYGGCLADLDGRGSGLDVTVGYLGRGHQAFDMNYEALHRGKKTQSQMAVSGVLGDSAFKLFRGTIDFKLGSSGAKGDEKEDVLIMGDDAVNQTIPLILCAEEDVEGNHGASIGRLDDELLFYLCSRGMSEEAAGAMISRARIDAVSRKIGHEETEKLVSDYLREVLGDGQPEDEDGGGQDR